MIEDHPLVVLAREFKRQHGGMFSEWNELEVWDNFTNWNDATWPDDREWPKGNGREITAGKIKLWFTWTILTQVKKLGYFEAKEMVDKFFEFNKHLLAEFVLAE